MKAMKATKAAKKAAAPAPVKAKKAMKHEIVQIEEMLDLAGEKGDALKSKIDEETKARNDKIEAMRKELAAIQGELSGNVRDCVQFKQIKGVIMAKNKEVKEARAKLKSLQ